MVPLTVPIMSLYEEEGRMLAVGSKAPAFRIKDHLGREVSLSDFAGRNVVLWFYPKADTPG
jgi:peroxiredoxin Q/BCP